MTFIVGVHSFGGSAGEAMDPQALVHVETFDEAKAIVKAIKKHPANKDGYAAGVVTQVPEVKKFEDAISEAFECYLFEEFEWDGCEDLTDEEYEAEIVERHMSFVAERVEKFRTGK